MTLCLGLAVAARAETTFQWKMQSLWQAGSINQRIFEAFCERVGEMTDGRLQIEP
jgi:TRAP-type C4-dicarboxylate transport system substrate-binding protein